MQTPATIASPVSRPLSFWLRPSWWVRAFTFWWVPALLGAAIAVAGAQRLLRGGVGSSWRGLDDHK